MSGAPASLAARLAAFKRQLASRPIVIRDRFINHIRRNVTTKKQKSATNIQRFRREFLARRAARTARAQATRVAANQVVDIDNLSHSARGIYNDHTRDPYIELTGSPADAAPLAAPAAAGGGGGGPALVAAASAAAVARHIYNDPTISPYGNFTVGEEFAEEEEDAIDKFIEQRRAMGQNYNNIIEELVRMMPPQRGGLRKRRSSKKRITRRR